MPAIRTLKSTVAGKVWPIHVTGREHGRRPGAWAWEMDAHEDGSLSCIMHECRKVNVPIVGVANAGRKAAAVNEVERILIRDGMAERA